MTRNVHNAESLAHVVASLEERYGMTSHVFYERYSAGESLDEMPRFHRYVWASFCRDLRRLHGSDFAERAERTLALA